MSLAILTVLGLLLLKLSLNILTPRQWTLQQNLADAYLTYEKSYAQRIPFDELTAADSPFPAQPQKSTQVVEIGRTPGGTVITGTVYRTRVADPVNFTNDGGSGTPETNPTAMKIWRVQSVLTYKIGTRLYVKSRTVVRAQ